MNSDQRDIRLRLAVFEWLKEQVNLHGDVLPRTLLAHGMPFEGRQIPLISQKGIFKPRAFKEIPISITTTLKSPYGDTLTPNGFLQYSYRGDNPHHADNVGLRKAFERSVPLVHFHWIVPGSYLAVWPVYIVGDMPEQLMFNVAVDDAKFLSDHAAQAWGELREAYCEEDAARRRYITQEVRKRLHQHSFRVKILRAYGDQCAFCKLKHPELLDAAHIIGDKEEDGEPVITNGMALCKLHHAAFDRHFIGVRPDYMIEIKGRLLEEHDGPMLQHGIKGLHHHIIVKPRKKSEWPDQTLLSQRYERFKEAG